MRAESSSLELDPSYAYSTLPRFDWTAHIPFMPINFHWFKRMQSSLEGLSRESRRRCTNCSGDCTAVFSSSSNPLEESAV